MFMGGLLKSRVDLILNSRQMYKDLFSWQYLIKNSLVLNYHYHLKEGIAPPVMNIDIKVTKRCNANCYFCYTEITKGKAKELNLNQIKEFVNSFGKEKKAFFLTGGEPFLRLDIFEIIKAIKKQGSSCGIVTNGTLLTESGINQLLDSGLDNIVFSMHGISKTNDEIMELRKTVEKMTGSINLLNKKRKNKHPFILVNSVINPKTFKEFKQIVHITEKAGADAIRFSHPCFLYINEAIEHKEQSKKRFGEFIPTSQFITSKNPIYSGDNSNSAIKIEQLTKFKKEIKSKIDVLFYPTLNSIEEKRWYNTPFKTNRKCLYLYTSSFINELGEVNPCQFYPMSMGNILEHKFEDIWNSKKYQKFRKMVKESLLPGCSRCCKLF
ncbi:MAG: radical SAM protein [Nanoarchaeota archaeon]